MTNKKHKLRLRKQVVISIPIILFIIMVSIFMIFKDKKTFSSKIDVTYTSNNNENIHELSSLSNKYVNSLEKYIQKRQIYNTIFFYADFFKIDGEKALENAKKTTDNFEDTEYLENFIIPSKTKKNNSFSSMEAGIAYYIKDLYSYPERYGFSLSEIRKSNSVDSNKIIKNGKTYVSNGNTFEQFLGRICDLYGVDKTIALAIVYEETGVLKSGLFKNSNNVGGQRGYDGWLSFPTLEAGTISFVLCLRNLINSNNIDLSNNQGILDLSSIYVHGHVGNPSTSWTDKIHYFSDMINQKDLFNLK